jgi:hypothetical protein
MALTLTARDKAHNGAPMVNDRGYGFTGILAQ